MLINSDATLFHRNYDKESRRDVWIRTYIPEVWWYDDVKSSVTVNGLQVADAYIVRIPDLSIEIHKDDFIVQGKCDREIDTVKDLPNSEKMRVMGAKYNRFGDNPHIKVVGV